MSEATSASRALEELDQVSDLIDDVHLAKVQLDGSPRKLRDYDNAIEKVKTFYKIQHEKQTLKHNIARREHFKNRPPILMGLWEAMEMLETVKDDSDPDTDHPQSYHAFQTAEAMRARGEPEWMQITGLVHDMGKLLTLWDHEQWEVVGDTFPVGCQFTYHNEFPEDFAANPDFSHPVYSTKYGIYEPNCGLDNVMLSWGHDEYLYSIFKDQSRLPEEALAMIRYHSFYPWHFQGGYTHLTNEKDEKALAAVKRFNPYDLYSKTAAVPDVAKLRPYYEALVEKYFPPVIRW